MPDQSIPAAPAIDDPDFGPYVLRALDQTPDAHAVVRRILAKKLNERLPMTVLSWMQRFPSLSPIYDRLLHVQIDGVETKRGVLGICPILVWASRQTWASEVLWRHYYQTLYAGCAGGIHVKNLGVMIALMKVQLPLMPYLTPESRVQLVTPWFSTNSLLWQSFLRWNKGDVYTATANAWAALGMLVQQIPGNALSLWSRRVGDSLRQQDTWHQSNMVATLLASNLDNTLKCQSACGADSGALRYDHTSQALLEVLPPDEVERANMLPWATPVGVQRKNSQLTYMLHEAANENSQMMQIFCPSLYSVLVNMLPSNDWATKATVMQYVKQMSALDTLALPELDL